jgi:hypothetical protein
VFPRWARTVVAHMTSPGCRGGSAPLPSKDPGAGLRGYRPQGSGSGPTSCRRLPPHLPGVMTPHCTPERDRRRAPGPGPRAPSPRSRRTSLRSGCPLCGLGADGTGRGSGGRARVPPSGRQRAQSTPGGPLRGCSGVGRVRRRLGPPPGITRGAGPGRELGCSGDCLASTALDSGSSPFRVCLHTGPEFSGSPLVSLHPGASRCRSVDAEVR